MTAAEAYLAALREAAGQLPLKQKRSPEKKPTPTWLAGGCLLYRMPNRKRERFSK